MQNDNHNDIDKRIEALLKSQEEFRKGQEEFRRSEEQEIEGLREAQKKTDEKLKETSALIERLTQKTDKEIDKTDKEIDKVNKMLGDKGDEVHKMIKDLTRKTDKEIDKVQKMVGDLTDGWGKFVIGLSEPSILSSLQEMGYNLVGVTSDVLRKKDGKDYEIDLLCPIAQNGKVDVMVIEVKSSVNQQKVSAFFEKLARFKEFFVEYSSSQVFGGIAGIRMTKDVQTLTEKKGLYLFTVKDGLLKKINSEGFKPKVW